MEISPEMDFESMDRIFGTFATEGSRYRVARSIQTVVSRVSEDSDATYDSRHTERTY